LSPWDQNIPIPIAIYFELIEEKTSFNRRNNDERNRKHCHPGIKIFPYQLQYILRLNRIESGSVIHPLHSLAHGEAEPGEETTTQYDPQYGVVQLLQHR
jgi:hypothetical protein